MRRSGLLAILVIVLAISAHAATAAVLLSLRTIRAELMEAPILADIKAGDEPTMVFDRDNNKAFAFYTERRINVPLSQVSPNITNAVLAAEDRRFHQHHGLDFVRIAGAAWNNLREGRIAEGGSTITQQLARTSTLTPRRTYSRKLREAILAAMIEERYTKDQILEQYLNRVYFGDGHYGIEAAARGYFGKPAAEVNIEEGAMLAGLVKSPSSLAPTRAPRPALTRRNIVLTVMHREGMLSDPEFQAARSTTYTPPPDHEKFHDHGYLGHGEAGGLYFKDELRRQLIDRFGEELLYEGGLRVFTTVDMDLQVQAEKIVAAHVKDVEARRRTDPDNPLQGSLVAIDPRTGEVLALVGGTSFHESSFNRATRAHRQPGSAFKPLIFAAALERGYSPGTLLRDLDEPIDASTGDWLPGGEHEDNQYTLSRALKVSSNRAAAQLLQRVGIPSALDLSRRLGIQSTLPNVPSLALGTGEVTLLELTSAYTTFANEGIRVSPIMIKRVEDREGHLLWEASTTGQRAITPATAFFMSQMMAEVVNSGTATTVRARGFKLPAAGKTGTTNDYTDTWFIGYTPRIVTGVWFGHDKPTKIMHRGFAARIAAPAWADFMKVATHGMPSMWFTPPPDVERAAICMLSGLRATDSCRQAALQVSYELGDDGIVRPVRSGGVVEEYFARGTAPWAACDLHGVYSDPYYSDSTTYDSPYGSTYGSTDPSTIGTTGSYPSEPTSPYGATATPPPAGTPSATEPLPTPAPDPVAAPPATAPPPAPPATPPPFMTQPRPRRVLVDESPLRGRPEAQIDLKQGAGYVPGIATAPGPPPPAPPPPRAVVRPSAPDAVEPGLAPARPVEPPPAPPARPQAPEPPPPSSSAPEPPPRM